MSETYKFDAEINQLMNIIINAFYSNKDVFLRELISNASDAIDKIRYESLLQGNEILGNDKELVIKIIPDKDNKTITIYDNGIGMTKKDLIENLGTMARSGTKAFMQTLEKGNDINLIGQFGVGFYSVFLVGNKVTVISKNNNDDAYVWESNASDTFNIYKYENTDMVRGTKIIIHLKEDQYKYLEEETLKKIIEKHSNYIKFPIYLYCEKTREVDVEEPNNEVTDSHEENEVKVEDVEDDKDTKEEKKSKKITEKYNEFDLINKSQPIWTKNAKDVTDDEYKQFYKSFTNDWQDYLLKVHFNVEGATEFTCLLFIPQTAPYDIFDKLKKSKNIKLFVKRVLIADECENIVPEYLNFVKGLVDSNDLPLNVSREMLQENNLIKIINKHIVKKCIDNIYDLSVNDVEQYKKFYEQYYKNIKLGIHTDDKNRNKLLKLVRFFTTKHKNDQISFDTYVKEMKEEQKDIYYLCGESIKTLEDSPFLELLNKKGYDIILFIDPMDEYYLQQVKEYENKKLVDISKNDLNLDNSESKTEDSSNKEYDELFKFIKDVLGDRIEKVTLSNRIVTSPCVLTSNQFGLSANMERILKAQALSKVDQMYMMMANKRNLEINPNNKLVKLLKERYDKDKDDKFNKDLVLMLYDSALLVSGFTLEKPTEYVNRIYRMLILGLSNDVDDDQTIENQTTENQTIETKTVENQESMENVD